jgi:DNA-binding NarL/FixJ family response regulator
MKTKRTLMSRGKKITLLLVDDHVLVRRGFRRLLEDETHINVVGEAGDGMEAVKMARALKPKVVLMDWAMPKMNGLLATERILQAQPEIAILILSMHSEATLLRQAIQAGARGFILKSAVELDLASAITRVAAGEFVLDPQLSEQTALKRGRSSGLSPRELEVLQLIVDGKTNKKIAARLGLSENTVSVHRANIMRELGIHKTAELVVYALRKRLVNVP